MIYAALYLEFSISIALGCVPLLAMVRGGRFIAFNDSSNRLEVGGGRSISRLCGRRRADYDLGYVRGFHEVYVHAEGEGGRQSKSAHGVSDAATGQGESPMNRLVSYLPLLLVGLTLLGAAGPSVESASTMTLTCGAACTRPWAPSQCFDLVYEPTGE